MNELAQFVHALIKGRWTNDAEVLRPEHGSAISDVRPLLEYDPVELASWLDSAQGPAADWLILPANTFEKPCL